MSSTPPPIQLKTDCPLALLPVRLETRFSPESPPKTLLVRVFPDDVHVDTHEEELTRDEIDWGLNFRAESARDPALAWARLAAHFGPRRAAWVARAMDNYSDASPPKTRAASWTREPYTYVMPDRWFVVGYQGETALVRATGGPVKTPTLAVGPSPQTAASGAADPGTKWMTDFAEAERVGMGVRVALTGETAAAIEANGLDRLLVFGVLQSSTAADSAARLARLLDAHHFTRGLSFVPQSAPSNNTDDAPSAYAARDTDHDLSYRVERGPKMCDRGDEPSKESNGDLAARALGVPASVFAHVRFAGPCADTMDAGLEQKDARHMNNALWPATWGYYLSQMMAGVVTDRDHISDARRHFAGFVRARGPLPALRVGRQPYGLLPVTSLDRWQPTGDAFGDQLAALLNPLRRVWRDSLGDVPRVGPVGGAASPRQGFMKSLFQRPNSSAYVVRNFVGPHFMSFFWSAAQKTVDAAWWAEQMKWASALLQKIGRAEWSPRVVRFVAAGAGTELTLPTVQDGAVSESQQLALNYIKWLRASSYKDVRDGKIDFQGKPVPLLYLLLRHAALLEYAFAGYRYRDTRLQEFWWHEAELVNFDPAAPTLRVWDQLTKAVGTQSTVLIGDYLDNPSSPYESKVMELTDFRASLDWLAARPTAVLARLLPETLDLCTYRLDAWVTSLATRRLAMLRNNVSATGVYLGGYGWVENLKPDRSPRGTSGFVHAPSLTHAATAAVLRGAYLSRGSNAGKSFAVGLTSGRVRLALGLLEGVRQGSPLAALLGYRFERGLHERGLARYVAAFRKLAPLSTERAAGGSDTPPPLTGPEMTIAANNVVDGLALRKRWAKARQTQPPRWAPGTIPFGVSGWGLPVPDTEDYSNIALELSALDDAVDAIGDLLVSESVYQTVRGNTERATAALDSLGRGDSPPPEEVEVVRTPRTGVSVTHRLFAPFTGTPASPSKWTLTPRAKAEPHLNAWVGRLLGSPERVRCRVEYFDLESGQSFTTPAVVEVTLAKLALSPLDLIHMAKGGAQSSELERRLLYWARRNLSPPESVPAGAGLRADFSRDAAWPANVLGVAEFLEAARAVERALASSRALAPEDLMWPGAASQFTYDSAELAARADAAHDAFRSAADVLRAFAPADTYNAVQNSYTESELETPRRALLSLADFGVPDAVPHSSAGATARERDALIAQAYSLKPEVERRLAAAEGAGASSSPTEDECRRDVARLEALFGPGFRVLTRFTLSGSDGGLQTSFNNSLTLQGGSQYNSLHWFQRVSRVRAGASNLAAALLCSEAANYDPVKPPSMLPTFHVGQLPYKTNDRWVGLEGGAVAGNRLSLVALASSAVNFAGPFAGLVFDEWSEVVPATRETTGVSFNYNEPGARAPQSILLAVAPAGQDYWSLETLEATLAETLELAKLRAVDPDALKGAGQFLPALYFAVNKNRDTVSTDFFNVTPGGG
ncbi:MAG TPA: hypothetical protein VF297_01930 [Pyrinomonadaceae bacterium]